MKAENYLTIADWDQSDKPREKLMEKGADALSNAELIAILIRSGSSKMSAVDLSKHILADCRQNLNVLAGLELSELLQFKGIGEAKALSIIAAFELGKRKRETEVLQKKSINGSLDAFELMQTTIAHLPHEEFWAVFLNQTMQFIGKSLIARGGWTSTSVDTRLVFNKALEFKATNIILFHNHPSGSLTPSRQDSAVTERLCRGAALLSLKIVDHLILYQENFYSFADHGLIKTDL
jgi:DNA repair protein RadC